MVAFGGFNQKVNNNVTVDKSTIPIHLETPAAIF